MLFATGDKVLLSTCNLNLTDLQKFKDQYTGPFVVQEMIGEVAYKLDVLLWAALHNVHTVFHISLLHAWLRNGLHHIAQPVDIDDKDDYEFHCIKTHCMHCSEL